MLRSRATKIIATLGPASSTEAVIEALHNSGADLFRLNFSHGSYDDHATRLNVIRRIESRGTRPIGVLLDLQGPKLRVSTFRGGRAELVAGADFRFDRSPDPGDETRVCLPHAEIFATVKVGDILLVNDGQLRFEVVSATEDCLATKVIAGGVISDRKGVNVPTAKLPLVSAKDNDASKQLLGSIVQSNSSRFVNTDFIF
jgi:pyruvate kinase